MTLSVLIVDDDEDTRMILKAILAKEKYRVFVAADGKEALELLQKEKIDLILSDLNMPGITGRDLLIEMNRLGYHVPFVIFISGANDMTFEEAYDFGAHAVLEKPVTKEVLMTVVQSLLMDSEQRWSRRPPRYEMIHHPDASAESSSRKFQSQLVNIGRGGAFLSCQPPFPQIGDEITFQLDLVHDQPFTLKGTGIVKWVRKSSDGAQKPAGFGLEFILIDEPGRSIFKKSLESMSDGSYIPIGFKK